MEGRLTTMMVSHPSLFWTRQQLNDLEFSIASECSVKTALAVDGINCQQNVRIVDN